MLGFFFFSMLISFILGGCKSVLFMWALFFLVTLSFTMLMKISSGGDILFYFVIQEVGALCFLLFCVSSIQLVFLLMKVGVSPFHFWVLSFSGSLEGISFVWFLVWQKVPYFVVLWSLLFSSWIMVLSLGILFLFFQILCVKSVKSLFVLSSLESLSWLLLLGLLDIGGSLILAFLYFSGFYFMLGGSEYVMSSVMNKEMGLWGLGTPGGVPFFLKFIVLGESLDFGFIYFLFLLFVMGLSVLAYSFLFIKISKNMSIWMGSVSFGIVFLSFLLVL